MIHRRTKQPDIYKTEAELRGEEAEGRAILAERLKTTDSLNIISGMMSSRARQMERLNTFRDEYIFPKLSSVYGAAKVAGARLMFRNPRNVEACINCLDKQVFDTPICDEWDETGVIYTTEELEL